jgi:hypothetical protein
MTDARHLRERRAQIARYRALEREVTDPLAACLLHEIISELEAELEERPQDALASAASQVDTADAVSLASGTTMRLQKAPP